MKSQPSTHTEGDDRIAFLGFQLDRRGARLTQDGKTIPLRPKTWAVLSYLAERPGVLVTGEELLDAVWPNVAVTPSTLTKSIVELRAALGDDAREPRCIETVHRRGFRFIASTSDARAGDTTPLNGNTRDTGTQAFVGRQAELQQLHERFVKACTGERQVVLVTGPTGVGKTALVEAFLDSPALRAGAVPVRIARGVCVEQHGAREAYMPVFHALEGLVRRPDAGRLPGLLRRVAPTWLAQMPWLLDDDADTVRRVFDVARPERMLREFAALSEQVTTEVPLVLVLEDLHWSDPSTVGLLSFLAQRREPARLLIIATYRPNEVATDTHVLMSAVQTLKTHRQCSELPLHDLSEEELRHYLERRFPGADFAAALATKIHQYTDGNPLFMISVVEHELLRGWIIETDPGWALTIPLDRLPLEVPEDTREMIEMELASLSPADRTLLEAASVAGAEFAVPAVAAALECSGADVEARCHELARRRWFLRGVRNAERPDGSVTPCYAFTHELYRNVAYAEIPEGRRQRWHQRIGEHLEAAYGERATEIAAALAVHFECSRDYARAVRYLVAAAALARRRSANREAVNNLEDALACVTRLPDGGERHRHELELRLALSPILSDMHGFASEPVRENCERAHKVCVGVGSPEQLFQILYSLLHLHWHRGDRRLGPEILSEIEDLASPLGPMHHLVVGTALVRAAFHSGRYVEACRLAEERLPAAGVPDLPFMYGTEPVIAARCHTALAHWMLGHTARARAVMDAALEAAWEYGAAFTLTATMWFACMLEVLARNPEAAEPLAEQTLALCAEHAMEYWRAVALSLKGWVLAETGRLHAGIETLHQARAAIRANHGGLIVTHTLAFLAEAHRRAGEVDAGLAAVDEALQAAETTLDRSYWPELWRIKGELLLARPHRRSHTRFGADPHWHEAESCLLRAVEMARQSEAKSLELRAATSLARAWHARERTTEAHALLSEIDQWFGTDAETVDLAEARTLLHELGTSMRAGTRRRK